MLPDYIERDHDRQLRHRLATAAAGEQAALVLVRGESCTGKTRAAFEAVQACLRGWGLVSPKSAKRLLAVLDADADALAPRTVLWLNEAQNFLTGPDGEDAAAALHSCLEGPVPVVILGSLWPEYHRALTATPEPGEDLHPNARALLDQAELMDVPAFFAAEVLDSPRVRRDRSLATAVSTSTGGRITQTLAAGPQLVDHYEQAVGPDGPYGRAVITAAMDARRFGHTSHLSVALLRAAALGYLTEQERADAPDTWFAGALVFARTKVKGVVAGLEPVADPTGMGSLPEVYRLADYLDHHARRTRRYRFPPDSFWIAALGCSAPNLRNLAAAARFRSRYRIAAKLYRQAADAGDVSGLLELAALRVRVGDMAGAEQLYRQAAAAGDARGLLELAGWRRRMGDHAGAEQLYRQAAAAGDAGARRSLEDLRQAARDLDRAAEGYWRAAGGNTAALRELAGWRRRVGDREGAERLLRQAADGGDTSALWRLAELRTQVGDDVGAEQLYRYALVADSTGALLELARQCENLGDTGDAERLYRQAADAGDPRARLELAALRARLGDQVGAERLYRQAAAAGALLDFTELRQVPGDFHRAALDFEQDAEADRTAALLELARQRDQVNDLAAAESLYRLAAARGTRLFGQLVFVQMRCQDAELVGAETTEQAARRASDTESLLRLAYLHSRTGDSAGAEQAARQAADAGDPGALMSLAALRERAGDRDGAALLRRFGLAADGSGAGPWEV